MSPIQKAATAAVALTITLTGAFLVTAPLTFAGSRRIVSSTRSGSPTPPQLMPLGQTGLEDLARTGNPHGQS